MEYNCYLGIGSNLGNKKYYLDEAVRNLQNCPQIKVVAISKYYESEPFGVKDQPMFLNAVVKIKTTLSPFDMLSFIAEIENRYGRVRAKRWGPRTLDLDILLYDKLTVSTPELTIPHPYLEKRDFVLIPLAEIEPKLILPSGRKINDAIAALKEKHIILSQN